MADKQYYLNNPALPTSRASFEYTPQMVQDIKKCGQNILHFAENFFYIIDPDEGKTVINLFKCQKQSLRTLRDNRYNILLASRQIGKALAVDTPIPTPNGWTTMGQLKDNDQVYAADGSICNVVKAHDAMHDRKCYKVIFDNGEEIVADAEHLWFTQNRSERRSKQNGSVKTTQQLFETLKTYGDEPNHRIPACTNYIDGMMQDAYRAHWHYIKDIQEVDSVPVRCITVDSKDNLYLCSKQYIPTHNTTMLTIYALWVACFNDDQNIVIVANKESTAIEIFRRVRMAYEQLPNWLKPGVIEYGKTSLMLDNGSRIGISTTTGSAARGTSLNVLILDELAFIDPPSIMEDFWRSVWPTISRSKKSKVLIASTPNGTDNLFYKLYDGSMRGENSFVTSIIKWDDVPGRDEEWKKEQIKILGSVESFEQEFNCTFLQKGESSIDAELFEKFKNMCSEAVLSLQDGKYKIWKMPQDNRIYIAGVDVAEGVGQDYSVIQILDITDLTNIEQVACFRSNTIDVPNFTTQLHEILTQWGKPLAMIERNNCGAQVVDNLHHIHKYENIINYGSALAGRKKEQMGVVAHTNTKHKGVLNMRYWVNELQCVRFNDVNTIQELKEFVRKPNGTWSARGSSKDDCVMSLIWALMALDNDANNGICQRYFEILNVDDNGKPSAIKCMDFGLKYYTRPVHSALSMHAQDADSIASICFGNDTMQSDEMQDLESAGWQLLR